MYRINPLKRTNEREGGRGKNQLRVLSTSFSGSVSLKIKFYINSFGLNFQILKEIIFKAQSIRNLGQLFLSLCKQLPQVGIFTWWIPCWASLGWLDLTLVFILCGTDHGAEEGIPVSKYSAWSKMSWAPAAKCTPSPTASREILLRNAIVPERN